MRTTSLFVSGVLLQLGFANAALATDQGKTYLNQRFGFSVVVPTLLNQMAEPPANDDGRTFLSRDGRSELLAFGSYNVFGYTAPAYLEHLVDDTTLMDDITYKQAGEYWAVVSGYADDSIVYQKTVFICNAEIMITLLFTYPAGERKTIDPLVSQTVDSLGFGVGYGVPDNCDEAQ